MCYHCRTPRSCGSSVCLDGRWATVWSSPRTQRAATRSSCRRRGRCPPTRSQSWRVASKRASLARWCSSSTTRHRRRRSCCADSRWRAPPNPPPEVPADTIANQVHTATIWTCRMIEGSNKILVDGRFCVGFFNLLACCFLGIGFVCVYLKPKWACSMNEILLAGIRRWGNVEIVMVLDIRRGRRSVADL